MQCPYHYCEKEVFVVLRTDAVIEPPTVVVEAFRAPVTLCTVLALDQCSRLAEGTKVYKQAQVEWDSGVFALLEHVWIGGVSQGRKGRAEHGAADEQTVHYEHYKLHHHQGQVCLHP